MKWLGFLNGSKKEELAFGKSSSSRSQSNTTSGDFGMRRSGSGFISGFNSQTMSDISSDSARSPSHSFSQRQDNLRCFTFADLKTATKNFSRSLMVGEGGFGCVFKGVIKSTEDPQKTIEVAVKQLNRKGLQGHKEWLMELNVLGIADHPNLVKLIGYCAEDDERGIQRLLVYEFMPNRSVDDHLSTRSAATLSWAMRLKVAQDAARGLAYLHEEMEHAIIFRDFKTSNILLDEKWNAKLSDFGLARQGPMDGLSHVSTAVVGTLGYAAPEYLQTGRLTVKSDIWSYGVVLYELITGRHPIDRDRPKGEQKLLEWVKPYVFDQKRLHMIIDPRLSGKYDLKSVHNLSKVANNCLRGHPKHRPKMSEILEMVNKVVEHTDMGSLEQPLISRNTVKEETLRNGEKLQKKRSGLGGKETGDLKEKLKKRLNFKRRIGSLKGVEHWWIRMCFWNPKGAIKR